jgi:hypothetical protein
LAREDGSAANGGQDNGQSGKRRTSKELPTLVVFDILDR